MVEKGRVSTFFFLIFPVLIYALVSASALEAQDHRFFSGRVEAILLPTLVVEGNELAVHPQCQVAIQKRVAGVIHEDPAKIEDLRVRDRVTVRINSEGQVDQIFIERYH